MNLLKLPVFFTRAFAAFFACTAISAATFTDAFNHYDKKYNNGKGFSNNSNYISAALAYGGSNAMMSYMKMYRATYNLDYLKTLAIHANNIIKQRDNIKLDENGNLFQFDYRGVFGPVWSTKYYSYRTKKDENGNPIKDEDGNTIKIPIDEAHSWVIHTGNITYPMADFAQLVINNEELYDVTVELSNPAIPDANLLSTEKRFIDIANWLVVRVAEAIEHHQYQWDNNGIYRYPNDAQVYRPDIKGGLAIPLNMNAAMGRSLLMMYLATKDPVYEEQVKLIANYFRPSLIDSKSWFYTSEPKNEDRNIKEDISHATYEINFAKLCYQNGIVFTRNDMDILASNFKNNIYKTPFNFSNYVDGTDLAAFEDKKPVDPNEYPEAPGHWVVLSEYDQDIYHIAVDPFLERALDALDGESSVKINPGATFLSLANLQSYQGAFEPIAVNRGPGKDSNFAGTTVGDFDGDSIDEIITVRNFDGRFFLYEYEKNALNPMSSFGYGADSEWAGVAAGDFDGDGKDEFVAVRNFDGRFYLFEVDENNTINQISSFSYSADSEWAGVAAGDFDGDGKDEFVGVRNYDGRFYLFEVDENNTINQISSFGYGADSEWVGVTAGDFNGDGKDEFVGVRNFDGNFYLLEVGNDNKIKQSKSWSQGEGSRWSGISSGDFNGDGSSEIIANHALDGDFYIFTLDGSYNIKATEREYFPLNMENGVFAAGNISATNSDDLVMIRNVDADIFVYDIHLEQNN